MKAGGNWIYNVLDGGFGTALLQQLKDQVIVLITRV